MSSKIFSTMLKIRKKYRNYKYTNSRYSFINRTTGKEKYLIILAGYKEYLYESVFNRLIKYVPEDIDICLISSGKYDEKLDEIAKKNNWSYLSTKKNKVALAQNLAIKLNKNAKYIYKMDEDIFLTKNCFQILFDTYQKVKDNGNSDIGFIAPIMPLNGYGHMKILENYNLIDIYKSKFEIPKYSSYPDRKLLSSPDVAKFFWGEDKIVKSIDALNEDFLCKPFNYSLCPIRYSIGFIMFERSLWENMGMFRTVVGSGMGIDEEQICAYCVNNSKPIVVSENSVVGHFSFGPQTKEMIKYYNNNKILFSLPD